MVGGIVRDVLVSSKEKTVVQRPCNRASNTGHLTRVFTAQSTVGEWVVGDVVRDVNAFTTGNPFRGTKSLESSIGRGFGGSKGVEGVGCVDR